MLMHGWYWGGWGWPIFGFGFLLWPLLILSIVMLIRGWRHPRYYGYYAPYQAESPQDILDRRYARGEITREQYQQMREDLRGHEKPAES